MYMGNPAYGSNFNHGLSQLLESKMNITKAEDILFEKWMTECAGEKFVKDGAPSPDDFAASHKRCLIVLKEVNWDQNEVQDASKPFELREQLKDDPDQWWRTVANWCAGITRIHTELDLSWKSLQQEPITQCLKPFAFMQLKKTPGGGLSDPAEIRRRSDSDKIFIKEQINIYEPEVILGCGTANDVARILGEDASKWKETSRGVRYLEIQLYKHKTYLIDYMHPSARAAKNVVCYGILDAYHELATGQSNTQRMTKFISE